MSEVKMNEIASAPYSVDYDPFSPVARQDLCSTPGQLEIWKSCQACVEASCTHNESFSVHLKGNIDDVAIDHALKSLVDFHEALRGHFSADGARFVIEPSMSVVIAQHDLSNLAPMDRGPGLSRLLDTDARTPYDLAHGPLFRTAVIRLGTDERVVLLGAHRTVCDGWSLDVLLENFSHLYSALAGDAELPVAPKHSFSDFIRHCETPEYSARAETSRNYWRKTLQALPLPLTWSNDSQRPAQRTYPAFHALRSVPTEMLQAAKSFARAQSVSLYSVLLSAFAALIHRVTGTNDFVVGIPIAGHPDAGMEDCVGYLVNVVPLRFRVEAKQSFQELCRTTNVAILDARENAAVVVGELIAELDLQHDPSRVPLVAAVFSHMHKYAPNKLVFADCSVDYRLNDRAFDSYELNLNVIESQDGLTFQAHTNADLYKQEWLMGRLRELENLLRHGCESPGVTIGDLLLSSREERGDDSLPLADRAGEQSHRDPTCSATKVLSTQGPKAEPTNGVQIGTPIVATLQRGEPSKIPLFLIFGIQLYIDVAMAINDGTPVVGMHVPIMYVPSRTPRPSLSEVAGQYVKIVRKARPSGPYRIGGLCFGGIVAYEVARLLQEQGEEVSLVILFDAVLPCGRHIDYMGRLADYTLNPKRTLQKALKTVEAAKAPVLSFGKSIVDRFTGKVVPKSDSSDSDDLIDLPFGTPEAKVDVAKLVASKPYIDAHLLAFRASRPELPPWDVIHPDMGWVGLARSLQFCDIASHHLGIVRPPYATQIGDVIMRTLARM
jgi:thioesterase domain-containing protein